MLLGRRPFGEPEAAVVDHQPAPVSRGVGAPHEFGNLVPHAAVDDDEGIAPPGRSGAGPLEPAVQGDAVRRHDAHLLDALLAGEEGVQPCLVDRERAEEQPRLERIEHRAAAAPGERRRAERRGDGYDCNGAKSAFHGAAPR